MKNGAVLPPKFANFPKATGELRKVMDAYKDLRLTAPQAADKLLEIVAAYTPPASARRKRITNKT